MLWRDLIRNSSVSLLAHKSRSVLTTIGIIIGVGAVIIVMSVGAGAQSLIVNQIKSVGSNLVAIFPGASDEKGPPASVMGVSVTTLTMKDAEALKDKGRVPHLVGVSPMVRGVATIIWDNRKTDTNFVGVVADYIKVESAEVDVGRFIDANEEAGIARVVVLGSQAKDKLFGDQNPLGESIKVKKERFLVIGAMKPRGTAGFSNQDDQIFIPIKTAQKILLGIDHLTLLRAKVDDVANMEQTVEEMKATLRDSHNISDPAKDDFSVRSQEQFMAALLAITNAVRYFLVAIAAIALIVGGIGIMNIMLVSVSERTREIGLRKAIGADGKSILSQFLVEAILITFIGGIAGIIFGTLFAVLVAVIARYLGYDWDLVISVQAMLIGTLVSIVIGLVFGLYPARRAAAMDPIEALRYE